MAELALRARLINRASSQSLIMYELDMYKALCSIVKLSFFYCFQLS
jgi:hypothetical protein